MMTLMIDIQGHFLPLSVFACTTCLN